jgi:acyl-CoA thioester hydrolase
MEQEDGVLLAVVEVVCRYLSPARYDDEIAVRTWIDKAHRRLVRFRYEILLAAGEKRLAHGHTAHVFLDREMKPSKLPPKYYELFGLA